MAYLGGIEKILSHRIMPNCAFKKQTTAIYPFRGPITCYVEVAVRFLLRFLILIKFILF